MQLLKDYLKGFKWFSKNTDIDLLLELPILKITGTRDKQLYTIKVEGYRRGLTLKKMHPTSAAKYNAEWWLT